MIVIKLFNSVRLIMCTFCMSTLLERIISVLLWEILLRNPANFPSDRLTLPRRSVMYFRLLR